MSSSEAETSSSQPPMAAKQEKQRRRIDELNLSSASQAQEHDPLSANYGDVLLHTAIEGLTEELKDNRVRVRGRAQSIREISKSIAFVVVREKGFTVQCVVTEQPDVVSSQMVKYIASLTPESIIDVEGIISVPAKPIRGASQKVEIKVRKLYCISRADAQLPFQLEDAVRSETEIENALKAGKQLARVNPDTRLDNRVLDLRTPANQAIFTIKSEVKFIFVAFLKSQGFRWIDTPKILEGSSEGGSAVFKVKYYEKPACLAQSPQLHKQMSICGDLGRVFEVGSVFRAEHSFTRRHLSEFIGLDVEMEIKKDYHEVMDIVDLLFVEIFDKLNETCKKELEAVAKQHPFEPLKYLRKTLRLTFEEGIQMLKDAGIEIDPFKDLNTEAEKKLGQLVLEKYGTEFYILHRYPSAARPFYTMPCIDNAAYSNSFDAFIRGEEIISGAQRVNDVQLLKEQAVAHGIDVETMSTYINSFRYGAPPHGGFGVGLERVVQLFLGLDNIRKASLFPRDPQRLAP